MVSVAAFVDFIHLFLMQFNIDLLYVLWVLFCLTVSEIWLEDDHLLSRGWEPHIHYLIVFLVCSCYCTCWFLVIWRRSQFVSVVLLAGRLYQVEYAMEAIGHAGTCLGILANDGVLLAAERRNIHKLLDEVFFSEKIYKLNEWVQ